MIIKTNLVETVARALCEEDLKDSLHMLTDKQYEALKYFVPKLEDFGANLRDKIALGHFIELNGLLISEQRDKPKMFICNIHNNGPHDIKDELWEDYKKFAEKAIEAYDEWLDKKYKTKESDKNV